LKVFNTKKIYSDRAMSLEEYLSGICWILLYRTVGTLQLVALGQLGQGIPKQTKEIKRNKKMIYKTGNKYNLKTQQDFRYLPGFA
jgi:hypothetical protein